MMNKIGGQDQVRCTLIATDVVRWHEERIVLPTPTDKSDVPHVDLEIGSTLTCER